MTRRFLVAAVVAVAALSAPFASTASAGEHPHGPGPGHTAQHRAQFVVHYSLQGDRTLVARNHEWAVNKLNFLNKMGAEAHIDGRHAVHFHMHGRRSRPVSCHEEGHELADRLRNYGFRAWVEE